MNCLELRRLKLADPRRLPGAAAAHLLACEPCRSFARRVNEQEAQLTGEIVGPVPEGLADRVMLRNREANRRPLRLAALAAAVLLTLAIGLAQRADPRPAEAARVAIAHVVDEPESFTMQRAVSHGELVQVAARVGGELTAPLGSVRYLKNCPVPGGLGWHLVMETGHGQATLILVPGVALKRSGEAREGRWLARAQPAGQGYYVVVADSEAALGEAQRRVRVALRWDT